MEALGGIAQSAIAANAPINGVVDAFNVVIDLPFQRARGCAQGRVIAAMCRLAHSSGELALWMALRL